MTVSADASRVRQAESNQPPRALRVAVIERDAMAIFINPGSGPVDDATEQRAIDNVRTFAYDLRATGHVVTIPPQFGVDCGDGRFAFNIVVDGVKRGVSMPGLPLDRVRWMGEPDQNIWDFPRLYIDGSSWVWKFALGACERDEDDA